MEKNRNKQIKGIKISTINLVMIIVSCSLYVFLIVATMHLTYRYKITVANMEDYIYCEEDAVLVEQGSDYLTEQVRLYTVTRNPKYAQAYFEEVEITKRTSKALILLDEYDVSREAYNYIKTARDYSDELTKKEIYAIELVCEAEGHSMSDLSGIDRENVVTEEDMALSYEEKISKAQNMVFDIEYQGTKELIKGNLTSFLDKIKDDILKKQNQSTEELEKTVSHQHIMVGVLIAENIIIFILNIILIVKPLHNYSKNIKEEKTLDIAGAYEFKNLAVTYNNMFELNNASKAMLSHQAEMLRHQAEHDPLTGIINRGAFNHLIQILKEKENSLGLMIIDVDKFKQVNDGYGHDMGDRVLKKVAKLLEDSFRSTDYPARIGGDEFAVILTDATENMKSVIAEKVASINTILKNPDDGLPQVSLSVGVAFSKHGFEENLYKNADTALYEVKENGRCGCRFYEGDKEGVIV